LANAIWKFERISDRESEAQGASKVKKLLEIICLFLLATTVHAQDEKKADCRQQVVEKDILTICHQSSGPFQHYHFSLSLNNQLIFLLVDDYVEKVELEHVVPEGPAIEFSLSKQAGTKRVKISGGCVPLISQDQTELARKCDFSWGKERIIRNVWFDFPDKEDLVYRNCIAGQAAVVLKRHAESFSLLDACIVGATKNDQWRRLGLIHRALANSALKNPKEALKDQEAAFAISPAQWYGELINMAIYQKDVGLYQEALRYLYQAELFDKLYRRTSMMTQYNIGWTLRLLGKNNDAVKVLTDAIPAQPTFNGVYYQRGLAYEALNNREAAKSDFEKVKEIMLKDLPNHMKDDFFAEISSKLAEYGITLDSKQN
jgi:tetratricopeptide (TPR) repeat protein